MPSRSPSRSASRDLAPARPRDRARARTQPYATLAPRVTHISSKKIVKKWQPLPPSSQERIKSLLLAVKGESWAQRRYAHLQHGNSSNSKTKTKKLPDLSDATQEVAVDDAVAKLVSRLPRMPFPVSADSKTGEQDFDFETTLDRIGRLEAELEMNVQQATLLREQIKREEGLLGRDKAELEQLMEGAKGERAVAKRQEGRLHGIARGMGDGEGEEMLGREWGWEWEWDREERQLGGLGQQTRRRKTRAALTSEEIEKDPRLVSLVRQLRSHLGTMQNNTAALQPVRAAVADAEGAVGIYAWKNLPREQYERVVGLST